MNLDFFALISNLISLFALTAVGFIAVRSGVLSEKVSSAFSALILKITLPCTIFISLAQKEYDPKFVHDSLIVMSTGIICFSASFYVSKYTAKFLNVPENSRGVWAFASTFSNCGFIGFPVTLALLGNEGLALSVMLNIAFNMVSFTLGAKEISLDNPNHNAEKLDFKSIIFSNLNIAIFLSLIFYFARINLPYIIIKPMIYLSDITTPLSMFMIGMILSTADSFEVFTDKYVWESSVMKLVIIPLFFCGIFKIIKFTNPLIGAVMIIAMAMPPATTTIVLCEMYKGNTKFAAKLMFVQNLICIVTIPLICMLI